MKTKLLFLLLFTAIVANSQTRQPFSNIGKKVKVVTLTDGKYDEFFDENPLQRVGSSVINVKTRKITKMEISQAEIDELENAQATRFLSVDPLTKQFPYYTPYQYAGNSPIANIDMDGLEEVHYVFIWVKASNGKEAVLKLGSEIRGTPTGKVDNNGLMTYKEPYKIYAHFPAEAFGETHYVTATYNSEKEFQNAKASDFYKDAFLVGTNRAAEIANGFGDMLAAGYIASSLTFLTKETVSLFVEQKLKQYSANLVNKQAIQDMISVNVRQQLLKSGLTGEAKTKTLEAIGIPKGFDIMANNSKFVTTPSTLNQKLALQEAMGNDGLGTRTEVIKGMTGDPRVVGYDISKWSYNRKILDANGKVIENIEIHYLKNNKTGVTFDFKFIPQKKK